MVSPRSRNRHRGACSFGQVFSSLSPLSHSMGYTKYRVTGKDDMDSDSYYEKYECKHCNYEICGKHIDR